MTQERRSWHHEAVEATRIDRWLWAVRLYKTRSQATDACRGGHIRLNGAPVKPSTTVRAGDRVTARVHDRDRDLEIVEVLDTRVGAVLAAESVVDHSPPPSEREAPPPTFARDRGAGRPTKRDRRQLDRSRNRRD